MSRASHVNITSGLPAWDGDVDGNFTLLFTDPFPIADFANGAGLPTASTNDDSLCVTTDTSQLWISDTVDWVAPTRTPIIIAVGDETTAISTGTDVVTFRMPFLFKVEEVRASLNSAHTLGTFTVDINEGGTSILSTLLTIDANETTSTTAAAAAVISDDTIADDAELSIDIDNIGSGGTPIGLKVVLIGRQLAV